jgi:YVTN family beta-propeller protein
MAAVHGTRAIGMAMVTGILGAACAAPGHTAGVGDFDARPAVRMGAIEAHVQLAPSVYRVVETIPVGDGPMGVVTGFGSVWVADHGAAAVSRIDPDTNRVVATIRVGRGPGHVATGYGAVWVTDDQDEALWRIDPRTNLARRIHVGGRISCVPALGRGKVWVTLWDRPTLVGIDARSGRVVSRITIDPQPLGVQFADGSLWVASAERGGHLQRIDPTTGRVVARVFLLSDWSWLQSPSVGGGALWVANPFMKTIARVNVQTNELDALIDVGYMPVTTFAEGALWVADMTGTLSRIDPARYRITDVVHTGTSLGGVAAGFGSIWVPSYAGDAVSRIAAST